MEDGDSLTAEVVTSGVALDLLRLRLSAQVAPRSWKPAIETLQQKLRSGVDLRAAASDQSLSMPAELRRLFAEAFRVPDPAGLVLEALRIRRRSRTIWHDFIWAMIYPLGLFLLAVLVSLIFNYCMGLMVSLAWLEDFGFSGVERVQAGIADQSHASVGLAVATFWFIAILATVRIVGPAWAWTSVVGGLIIVGKPVRWISLEELLHRYRLFTGSGLDTATATEATAKSLSRSAQSVVAERVARQVRAGIPLGEAISDSLFADSLSRPIIRFLDVDSGTPLEQRLEQCAETLRTITYRRCQTLVTVLPLIAMIVVGTMICSSMLSYMTAFRPLVQMITSLA